MDSTTTNFVFTKVQMGRKNVFKFQPSTMHILKWLNGFEFVTNDIKDHDEKLSILLNCLETVVYDKITETCEFEQEDVTYDWLISILIKLYSHCKENEANEMRLIYRYQYPEESIPDYVLALRKLSSKCTRQFKLSENLMKSFVIGLRDKEIKAKLMNEKDLTFSRAVYIARQKELSRKAQIRSVLQSRLHNIT